jgi:hypothetical protein
MKYLSLLFLFTACATPPQMAQSPRLEVYDLSNHSKAGRDDNSSFARANRPIGASHPVYGEGRVRRQSTINSF